MAIQRNSGLIRSLETDFVARNDYKNIDWTPVVTQLGSVTATVTRATYQIRPGKICFLSLYLSITGSGTAGNSIIVSGLPSLIHPLYVDALLFPIGEGTVLDTGTAVYHGLAVFDGSNQILIRDTVTKSYIGLNPSFALANGDKISIKAWYEIA